MYANGMVPLDVMIHLGGNHYLPPGTAARWLWLVAEAKRRYRVTLRITPDRDGLGGWNGYRPRAAQRLYKKHYGNKAAAEGFSTHGGNVGGREVFAIDVDNWAEIGWDAFAALCREAGFTVDFVVPREQWHIGDFNSPWIVPAFTGSAALPVPPEPPEPDARKDSDMFIVSLPNYGQYLITAGDGADALTSMEALAHRRAGVPAKDWPERDENDTPYKAYLDLLIAHAWKRAGVTSDRIAEKVEQTITAGIAAVG